MDLLLLVAKITPDAGEPQRIRLSQETMNALGVKEHDPVLVIHGQHSTQAGAIVGPPLPPRDPHIMLDVVTRYALGALEGHQVRIIKGNLEPGTSVAVHPRRRWKMPVSEADFHSVLQDRIVAPRQRIPLIKQGIWLDFDVASIVPETQMVRVARDTKIIVNSVVEKIATSNLIRNAESKREEGDRQNEAAPPVEESLDPILDATDLFNPALLPRLPPPSFPPPLERKNLDNPTAIPQASRWYYQTTWGFDPVAVLKTDGDGGLAYEAEIPLVNDPHLAEAGVTMHAHTQVSTNKWRPAFEWSMNNIIFRCGSQEGRASCVHTILHQGSLVGAIRFTDAIERGEIFPRPGSLAKLDPLEHFAALRSYCYALAEMGIIRGIESTISFKDTSLRAELGFGFNSSLQQQIMSALTSVAPAAVSRQLRELILWNVDKAPSDWLQGPGGKLFARRLSLANTLFNDPDLAPQLLQILQAKGVPLPADGDEKRKVATFFGIAGNHGERLTRDAIMQEFRDLFERRARNRGNPAQLQDLRRRLQERISEWQERTNRDGPAPPPPGPPPRFPPPPPPAPPTRTAENRPKTRGPRQWDDDDLNFFAV